jgi:DNA-binding MarR family transcriptional regulator
VTSTENLGFLLAKASQRWNELLLERFASAGFGDVRASYGSLLVPLFEQDGLRVGELRERARLSKQNTTKLLALCERDGLVERRGDPADRRAFRVALTKRGRAFGLVVDRVLSELDAQVLAALGRQDRDALLRGLKEVMQL